MLEDNNPALEPSLRESEQTVETTATLEAEIVPQGRNKTIKYLLSGIFIILLLHSLYIASSVAIPIVLSFMLSLLLSPVVRRLREFGLPPSLGALITVALFASAIGGTIYFLAEPTTEWMKEAPTALSDLRKEIKSVKSPIKDIEKAAESLDTLTESDAKPGVQKVEINKISFKDSVLNAAPSTLSAIGIILVLTYFLLASGNAFLRRLIQEIDTLSNKKLLLETIGTIQYTLSRYLYKISIINFFLGAAASLLMFSLGIPNYILWGVVAALLNFAPYVGPIATIAIYTLVSYVTFGDLEKAMIAPSIFLVFTALEGQFITPTLLGKELKVSPVAIILVIIIFGSLWGLVGVLLSVPLLVCAKIILERLPGTSSIANLIAE